MSGDHNMHQKPRSFVDRYEKVRELVKDPTLRVKDIAEQTGYDKGHVSRLRKEAIKKEWVGLTPREIELLDGMIEVQLHHAAQCDHIANRTMAEKQKGWDMERVALLRKLREKNT